MISTQNSLPHYLSEYSKFVLPGVLLMCSALPAAAQTTNIELILDASGSMAGESGSGYSKIEAARRAMEQVIASLPEDNPNLNVGLRIYGHKGDNSRAQKALSCANTELLVPVQGVDKAALRAKTKAFKPTGWTPISLALEDAARDLSPGANARNIIILVTDGEETCDRDPCAAAQALDITNLEVRVDVVGFGLEPEVAETLQCIPQATGGIYYDARDGDALVATLQNVVKKAVTEELVVVVPSNEPGTITIRAVGSDGKLLARPHKWSHLLKVDRIENSSGQTVEMPAGRETLLHDGKMSMELKPGDYTLFLKQYLGGMCMNSDSTPAANNSQRIPFSIGNDRETELSVGAGGLELIDDVGNPEYACSLALEVNVDGQWQAAHPAPDRDICHAVDGKVYGLENGLALGTEYPLLPGRYRLVDVSKNQVITDSIDIAPGKKVDLRITRGD